MKPSKTYDVVVTRHESLVQYLREKGIVSEGVRVITHAEPKDVIEKDVIGVLPLHLAVLAYSVTEVPLAMTPEDRGKELSLERIREIAGSLRVYYVRSLSDEYEDGHTTTALPHECAGAGNHYCGHKGYMYLVSPGVAYVPECEKCFVAAYYCCV